MLVRFLASHNVELFLDKLRQRGSLHGPVLCEGGAVRFSELQPGMLPDLRSNRTLLPPKKYLLHPQETILNYSTSEGYQMPSEQNPSLILFGLHPCDLAGINYLDRVFMGNDSDPLFFDRRSTLTLIGISCVADDFCSCHCSSSPLQATSDLFLSAVEGGYIVTSSTGRGDLLLVGLADVLEKLELEPPEDNRRFFDVAISQQQYSEPESTLPEWQQLANDCLGCGACSICCPTCYCFDVLEYFGLDGSSAERIRRWDNCLFKSHAEVAGGMNFGKDRAARFRCRYIHKYQGFGGLRRIASCVGCGRCRDVCPASLDLRPLAEQLRGGDGQ